MADGVSIPAQGTGDTTPKIATRTVTYSGEAMQLQAVTLTTVSGADDAKVPADLGSFAESGASALQSLAVGGGTPHDSVDSGNPVKIGGLASTAVPTAVSADGDRANLWLTRTGAANVVIRDTSGTAVPLGVQYAEDAAMGASGQGTLVVARRDDALSALTPVENDAVGLRVNSFGALWVAPDGVVSVQNVDIVNVSGSSVIVEGPVAHDSPATSNIPVLVGGFAYATAPTAVSTDGDAVNGWFLRNGAQATAIVDSAGVMATVRNLTANDALNVSIVDGSGNQITSFGGGTQYTEDAPLGAVGAGLGPLQIARASAAAPTSVSADADAVAIWALRNGAQVVNLASGSTLIAVGQQAMAASLPVVLASNQSAIPVTGTFWQATQPVSIAAAVPVTDNAGTLTVDAPVGTPVFVRLSDGTAALAGQKTSALSLPVVIASDQSALPVATHAVTQSGTWNIGTVTTITGPVPVTGTFWQATQPVSGTFWQATQPVSIAGTVTVDSELPAAVALADTLTPASTPIVGAALMGFNGTNYDRIRTANTGRLQVDVITGGGGGTSYVEDVAIGATGTGGLSIGKASTAVPTSMSADGDAVGMWLTRFGAVNVVLRDTSGAAVAAGTQYLEDGALGAVGAGQGTLLIGRASTALPTAVSADADAVGLWATRNGALNVTLRDAAGVAASPSADNQTTGLVAAGAMVYDSVQGWYNRARKVEGDTQSATGLAAVGSMLFNGSNYERMRSTPGVYANNPNTDTGVLAAGVGPGFDRKLQPTGVAATSTANAITQSVDGADLATFVVTTIGTTPGSMIFEVTGDDSTWVTAGHVIKLSTGPDLRVEGAFVPAVGDAYLVRVTGARQIRYRVNAVYASGTATVKVTMSLGVALSKGPEMAPPPHNFGYNLIGFTQQFSTAQTSFGMGYAPGSTERMVVTYLQIQAGGTVAGTQVTIYFGTGAYVRGTNKALFDGEFAPSATSKPGFAMAPPVPWVGGADEELRITNVGAINPLTVTAWFYIVRA
jgi:hypothetical protein